MKPSIKKTSNQRLWSDTPIWTQTLKCPSDLAGRGYNDCCNDDENEYKRGIVFHRFWKHWKGGGKEAGGKREG